MNPVKKISILFVLMIISIAGFAQEQKAQMADVMRSNGRIYVVVAVMVTILLGLILYLVRLDKKITRLEKNTHL
jgi:hypothetical protein